jgi:hypothetical protein
MMEKTDGRKQRKITEIFQREEVSKSMTDENESELDGEADESIESVPDMEDIGSGNSSGNKRNVAVVTKRKRTFSEEEHEIDERKSCSLMTNDWRKVLGNPPPLGTTAVI